MANKSSKSAQKNDVKNMQLEVIDPIYEKYAKSVIRTLGTTEFYEFFMTSVARAENEFQFSNRRVEKIVDITWVDAVEAALKAFQNIIASPRNVIKEEEFIVNVANAKKGGSDVVRHLATHASLVQDYNEKSGDVRPERLMQKYRDDTIGIYENRVVFSTLERAFHFVRIRHDALFQAMGDEFGVKLKVNSNMRSATENLHMDMFMHITDAEGAVDVDDKNRDVFDRISRLYRILSVLMSSQFASQMARYSKISGKIMKTNVLKRNPDYAAIVQLWDFLINYDDIGYAIKIIEQNPVISEDFERDIYHNILFNYLVLKGHLERDKDRALPVPLKEKKRKLKPKFIKQIIEELTEDYDLPDIEIRKVLIEELTKEQLMLEEEAERRRLVEEQEQRRREEEERLKREKEEEEERIRKEKEAEAERIRRENEIREAQLLAERMEREQEIRRRSGLFRKEADRFFRRLQRRLDMREEQETVEDTEIQDFADAAFIMEETERLKAEEAERARRRKQEERERKKYEARLERERIARELAEEKAREARAIAEEKERQRLEEERRQAELLAQDMLLVSPLTRLVESFEQSREMRLAQRAEAEKERIR